MKKITRTDLTILRNMEYFQCLADILAFFADKDLTALLLEEAVNTFRQQQTAYDEALIEERSLANPEGMNQADIDRDTYMRKLYYGALFYVEGYPNTEKQKAAKALLTIIDRFGGSAIADMPQAEESGTITNLLQDIVDASAELSALAFNDLVDALTNANSQFIALKQQKDSTAALAIYGKVKVARHEVRAAFAALCNRINALAVIEGEAKYADIIDTINHLVHTHLETAERRRKEE